MAIAVPYSLELTAHEDLRDITEGTASDPVAGKMLIFLGANVLPARIETVVGSLRLIFRNFRDQHDANGEVNADITLSGNWQEVSESTVDKDGTPGANDVALVVSGTFAPAGQTQYQDETFNQLIEGLLEASQTN